jgi:hypothetical protein
MSKMGVDRVDLWPKHMHTRVVNRYECMVARKNFGLTMQNVQASQ